ncbi:MAG: ATP-dependent helicase HrpB [Sulfurifustis sp.]
MNQLPINDVLPELQRVLQEHPRAVLQAPPGAGKTTLVPPALLDAPWLAGRRIVLLEPRRLAARAAAARMAEHYREAVGATVGYRIRFDAKVSARTRIEVVTEGVLTRRLQSDPALDGVGLVIFDEFHERHLETDLALALVCDAQRLLRPDLRMLVMSATLDGQAVARLLDAPLIEAHGRAYPVELRYVARETDAPLAARAAAAVRTALADDQGDILAFLPGGGEIRSAARLLDDLRSSADVYPLYGDLPWEQQDRALRPGPRRKVVLATPIAESSLTIEGVRIVVDGGYARVPQFDPASGLTRLATVRVARASADQRAGRAGRLGPGVCYRLWTDSVQRGLLAQPLPEIKTADLAGLALDLALWGVDDPASLTWLDPPPAAAFAQARALLRDLGALDASHRITPLGRDMTQLPMHPRLAHLIRLGERRGAPGMACDIAALLSERDVYAGQQRDTVDIGARLDALAAFRSGGRGAVRAAGADPEACARVDRAAGQWRRMVKAATRDQAAVEPGVLLAAAYPDRVAAQRRANETSYVLASGRGARLPVYEAKLRTSYVVAAHLDAGSGEGVIHLAASIRLDELRDALAERITTTDVVRWDDQTESVIARREERLGEIVLSAQTPDPLPADEMRAAMLEGVRRRGVAALAWTAEARAWQARVLSVRAWLPEENWPDVSDAALADTLEQWLGLHLDGCTRREHLRNLDLAAILRLQLDARQARRLNEAAPTHFQVPSGSRVPIEYRPGEAPVLAVKLQEMFGLADTPRVGLGRVPVLLHLLSPARRPIQVTQDLRGFWERTYADVRKELKGRYPKHPWPDDPWSATPTARTVRKPGR